MKLLVSLHDVAPFHLPRLRRAEDLCRDLGIEKITYLLIPDYHGTGAADENPEFVAWCRRERGFGVEWMLHGYSHLDESPAERALSFGDRLRRRFLTGSEGEFIALDSPAQRERIANGLAVFRRCMQREPAGFVAPAWLFNDSLFPILRDNNFRYTEDHRHVFCVTTGEALKSPVITWATRTALRKHGSIVAAPLLAHLWSEADTLRVAMHPFDFDHPETVASIRGVLSALLAEREMCFVSNLDFSGADQARA